MPELDEGAESSRRDLAVFPVAIQPKPNAMATPTTRPDTYTTGIPPFKSQGRMHHIRTYTGKDLPLIIALFTETVRRVNSHDYSPEQIEAWAPQEPDPARWRERLAGLSIIIGEIDAQIAGF